MKYTIDDFLEIIRTLRAEGGCPWDREQTHESLKPCVMEEAAELVSSIRIYNQTGNADNMREELGDLLLQVVMHSSIASEEGLFTWEDVVQEVSEKMVRRHPHVFGDTVVNNSGEVLKNWDDIKKKEKENKDWIESPLREIPYELPALTRAPKVMKKIDKLYKPADSYEQSVYKLQESVERLLSKEQTKKDAEASQEAQIIQKVIADMLWEISNIARKYGIAQEQILNDKIEDMIDLYETGKPVS